MQHVVLDETDQMLAVGFEEGVETILENVPKNRQTFCSRDHAALVKKLQQKFDESKWHYLVGKMGRLIKTSI